MLIKTFNIKLLIHNQEMFFWATIKIIMPQQSFQKVRPHWELLQSSDAVVIDKGENCG